MTKVSKKKADALVKRGGRLTVTKTGAGKAPEPAEQAPALQPVSDATFSKDQIKEIMIEAMKIAAKQPTRGTSRLVVSRDNRGFIDTIDIIPVESPMTLN